MPLKRPTNRSCSDKARNTKCAEQRTLAQAHRDTQRNLNEDLENAREYTTPLANVTKAAYLLCGLPHNEQTEEILRSK
jgi:hypothetical protein